MILIAGASGAVGYECVKLAKRWGAPLRTLSRSESNAARLRLRKYAKDVVTLDASAEGSLEGICRGVHTVVSCLGAPVDPNSKEKRSFRDVDTPANLALLDQALKSGVRRFLYVSLHLEPAYARTTYVMAHEAVVRRIRESGLNFTIIRPTGIYSALAGMLDIARKGILPRIGDGSARTNPIDPADVAQAISQHIMDGPTDLNIGGPQTFTRTEIGNLVFQVLGRKPRIIGVPAGIMRLSAKVIKRWNPRMAEMTAFFAEAATHDCIAPAVGTRKLEDYLRARAVTIDK